MAVYVCQSLVLIALAVVLLLRARTNKQTDERTNATERYTHVGGYAGSDEPLLIIGNWAWLAGERKKQAG